jgi:hypothetical protein
MGNNKLILGMMIFMSAILLIPYSSEQNAFASLVTDVDDFPPSTTMDFSQFYGGGWGDLCVGNYSDVNNFNWCFVTGPMEVGQLVGESITFIDESQGTTAVIGSGGYSLGSQGNWNSGLIGFAGNNYQNNPISFTFNDGDVCAVGGLINYNKDQQGSFSLIAFDQNNNILETYDLVVDAPINTNGIPNQGEFRGIVRVTNDIAKFTLSGGPWGTIDDLKFSRISGNEVCGIPEPEPEEKKSGGDNQWDTRPTFGVSHETRQGLIVENGFSFNGDYFTVTDNHHTDFAEQSVEIGTMNSFTATVYADKQLKVQEFLFGIPNVGESHLAELGVEIWYDRDGAIEDIVVDQDTAVIDEGTISVSHEKTKCLSTDTEPRCDTTTVSMTFLEPLADKVMAVKAIDYANRDQRTYLNDGFDISGDSLNPMLTQMIPSNVKNHGLLEVTQLAKYSPYWQSADGRMFEMNSFGSFKEINQTFERFEDTGNAFTRLHSGFGGILDYEQNRATQVFDSTKLISELPDSYGHHFEMTERFNGQLINDMLEQQEIAKKILEEMDKQNRHY